MHRTDHPGLACCSTETGSVKENVEPCPATNSTQIFPPCISEMRFARKGVTFADPKFFPASCEIVMPPKTWRSDMHHTPLMTKLEDLAHTLTSAAGGELKDLAATRRGLILAPLLAALPAALLAEAAHAIDPAQTQVTLPDQYRWKPAVPGAPAQSVETVRVFGATDKPGPYVVLIKWHPGYMSAPHTYVTDRLCHLISTTYGPGLSVAPNTGTVSTD